MTDFYESLTLFVTTAGLNCRLIAEQLECGIVRRQIVYRLDLLGMIFVHMVIVYDRLDEDGKVLTPEEILYRVCFLA